MWLSAEEGKELLFHQVQREDCAKFFVPEENTYISCFTDVATATVLKFAARRGTHTVFILGAEQQLLSSQKAAVHLRWKC